MESEISPKNISNEYLISYFLLIEAVSKILFKLMADAMKWNGFTRFFSLVSSSFIILFNFFSNSLKSSLIFLY